MLGFADSGWQVQSLAFILAAVVGMGLWRAQSWLKDIYLCDSQKVSLADERVGVN